MEILQILKTEVSYDLAIPLLSTYLEKTIIQNDTCTVVFTVALFAIAKTWKYPNCPLTDERIKKTWYIRTMKYQSAIKKNEIMPFSATRMGPEMIILSEVSQKKTNTKWYPLWNEIRQWTHLWNRKIHRYENKLVVAEGVRERGVGVWD